MSISMLPDAIQKGIPKVVGPIHQVSGALFLLSSRIDAPATQGKIVRPSQNTAHRKRTFADSETNRSGNYDSETKTADSATTIQKLNRTIQQLQFRN